MLDAQGIKASLSPLFSEPLNLSVYMGFGRSASREYCVADLDDEATISVRDQFLSALKNYLNNESFEVRALSGLDHRADILYYYDLDDQPPEFSKVRALKAATNTALFSFKVHDFSNLKTIVLKFNTTKNSFLFVKQFFPVSLVKRDQVMLVLEDDKRFTSVEKDILRITSGFEMFLLGEDFYILDVNKLERTFGFDEVTEREKAKVATAILALSYVADSGSHIKLLDVPKRDILRAKNSPVLKLPPEAVLSFVRKKTKQLGLKIVDGKIQLTSRASVRRFVKLLNDDYLISELTHIEYETVAKDKLLAEAS